ncbi:MAG TPA: DUF6460 domain-containing protein [Rhizobiaceae bacterium]|nr:DUF6460 domain-containing protein [Rhizobiaceae bacterium]
MWNFLVGLFKIVVISLLTGAALSAFDMSAADVLARIGLTEDKALELLQRGTAWALPNILLGSIIIVPVWLVMLLFRPPGGNQ